jgi:hypothetical protein
MKNCTTFGAIAVAAIVFGAVSAANATCYHKIGALCKSGYASGYNSDCSTSCTTGLKVTKEQKDVMVIHKKHRQHAQASLNN